MLFWSRWKRTGCSQMARGGRFRLGAEAYHKPPFVRIAANVSGEPIPAIVILCCERTQREKCGNSEELSAAAQRRDRPFMLTAARISGRIPRSPR